MKFRNLLSTVTVYVVVIFAALSIATLKMRAQGDQPAPTPVATASPASSPQPGATPIKPHFSLATNRTYGTHEKARVYISYQGIDSLDFRVYKVKDPFKFFKQLANPHTMGQADREMVSEVTETQNRKPSFLEKLRAFKSDIYFAFKGYFRTQIRREARTAFNDKYRSGERLPIDKASYAQFPLLNPDQLEDSFKQVLTPLDNRWDTRMVVLGQKSPGVYLVEAVNGKLRAYTIAVVSDLTMISKISQDGEVLVYTVDRRSGEPRDDANVQIVKGNKVMTSGKTSKDGLMRVTVNQPKEETANSDTEPEGDENVGPDDFLILADRKGDFAVSDLASYFFNWTEGDELPAGNLTSYIYTDRPVYRPEQKAYFKGILRQLTEGGYQLPESRAVHIVVSDPDGKEIFQKDLNLSPRGTFSGEVDIAAGAPLGSYGVVVHLNGVEAARGFFEVAEYKKPEYKVNVSTPKTFVSVGEKTKFTVEAKYYFGSPVKNADVKYYIYRSPYYPWFWESEDDGIGGSDEEDESGDYGYGNDMVKEGEGRLDENGRLEIPFDVPQPGANETREFTYRLEAMVTDAARREIEGRASFIGTRGNVSVQANPDRYVYYKSETAKIRVRTRTYEGKPVAAKVTLKFSEVHWEKVEKEENGYKYNEYQRKLTSVASGEVTTNAEGEATFEYKTTGIGDFDINAVVAENGRQIEHDAGSFYVTSESDSWVYNAWRDEGSIKLVADKKSYKVGETAKILALLPTDKAHLLVTTEMTRVMETRHVYADSRAVVIDLPIKDAYSPNIYLSVAYVKNGEMFEHSKNIAVPSINKFLNIELIPDKSQYKPRDPASYQIIAKNADGTPAAGVEVSLGLVDEAIYAIRPDTSGDIRRAFYGTRYSRVSTNYAAAFQFTGFSGDKKIDLAQNKRSYQLADFKNDSQYADPKLIRKDFRDTAFWQPDVVTAADGKATVKLNLPDNLTTWRATARAVTADLKVGSKVDKVVSRKDLILRLETPRFATEGDTVTISGIVHNYQKEEKLTQVELKVTGAQLLDAGQRTVTIPKDGEQRIDWHISASNFGNVTLLATAKTTGESDGIELPMPVVAAGTRVVKGESLALSEDTAQKEMSFVLPGNAHPQARTLRIEASPSVAGAMFGVLDYLTSYPYGCTEQTMSSFLPNVIVAQTVKEVKTASISTGNDLRQKVQRGLQRLYGFQHEDGGWGWWKDDKTDPFMTSYVMDGLALAERAGYGVEPYRIQQGRKKIQQLLDTGKMEDGTPFDIESRAYLLYAQQVSGGTDARYLSDMFNRRGEMQPYARALLALTLKLRNDNRAQLVASDIERSVKMTQADAYWESKRRPMLDFTEENSLEATAWSLKALSQINPNSELLPKAARWLVAHRRNGYYWETTKASAFAIFALTDYLRASKELTADYTLEVYLNGEQIINRRVTAAEAASGQPVVVERKAASMAPTSLVRVVKRGAGVAYVAVTQDFYTREESSEFSAGGLKLTREYLRLSVSDQGGKLSWKTEPLTGELRSGDMIVSRIRVMGSKSQYLLVEDPIPAGCEQVERYSGFDLSYGINGWSDWYSQREFRDQRTALFVSYFDGDATFQYAMRVQVPGQFRVAPARAELMYQPGTHANTANYRLNILDKK
ncbi:MAG: hypothetical protein JST85_23315 [Acidobacteria bacterium]|nr:hypothetical protein [Acidobacteriota bacterium]